MKKIVLLALLLFVGVAHADSIPIATSGVQLAPQPSTPIGTKAGVWFSNTGALMIQQTGGASSPAATAAGFVPIGRTLTLTAPLLIDGGASADLSADRTLSIQTGGIGNALLANSSLTVNTTAPLGGGGGVSLGGALTLTCATCVLTSGSYADPAWITALAGAKITGTVANATTAVSFSGSLSGVVSGTQSATTIGAGNVTASMLASTAVTPASYGDASHAVSLTIDQQGRTTAASSSAIALNASAITAGTLAIARGGTNLGSAGGVANRALVTTDGSTWAATTVPNAALANSSIVVSTTSPIAGGATINLGDTLTLSCPTCGTVTSVATGNGLQGGAITTTGTVDLRLNAAGGLSKTLGAGTNELGIAAASVSNAMLANASATVNTTAPVGGGGTLTLGSSLTLTCATCVTGSPSATGDLLYSTSGGQAMSVLADVATNNVLLSGGVGAAPAYGKVANAALSNSSLTVNTSSPLGGGGAVALGASLSLTCSSCLTGTPSATGDIMYSTAGGQAFTALADVAAGSYLRSGGSAAAPVWSTLTLPNAATTGDLLYASGSNAIGRLAVGTSSQVLLGGTTPAYGQVGTSQLSATGTPSSSTYLRGDNTWATVAGGSTGNWTFSGNNTDLSGAGTMGVGNGGTTTAVTIGASGAPTTIGGTLTVNGATIAWPGTLGATANLNFAAAAATAQNLDIRAQNGSGSASNGGNLLLSAGSPGSSGSNGTIRLSLGGTNGIQITPSSTGQSLLQIATGATSALWKQDDKTTNSSTGAAWTIQAQNETGTTATGGGLILTSGTGTTAAGNLSLQTGGTTRLNITPTQLDFSGVGQLSRSLAAALGTTIPTTPWITLTSSTAATVGAQQISGNLEFCGSGWKTTSTAAAQTVCSGLYGLPVQNTTNPTATLTWYTAINAGADTGRLQLRYDPVANTAGFLTADGLNGTVISTSGSQTLTLRCNGCDDIVMNTTPSFFTNGANRNVTLGQLTHGWQEVYTGFIESTASAKPTCAAGTGAGTGASCSTLTGSTQAAGVFEVVAGTTPTAAATVATWTFSPGYAAKYACTITAANAAAASIDLTVGLYLDYSAETTTTIALKDTGVTGLTASTTYDWMYHCEGFAVN